MTLLSTYMLPRTRMSQYGFISVYSGISIEDIKARIDFMIDTLNIRDFQLYDAFYTYSIPMVPGVFLNESKTSLLLNEKRIVNFNLIKMYTTYIRERNCRSWLYVQAVGADEPNLHNYTKVNHQHCVNGNVLFHCYEPNEIWAQRMCDIWVPFALYMKVDGIHWDSLGYCNGAFGDGSIFTQFLTRTWDILSNYNLLQTFNFVDGFGWNANLVWNNIIHFPYWEVWTIPTHEDYFFHEMSLLPVDKKGVFVCYTKGNIELAHARHIKCLQHNCKYLLFGDGKRILFSEYFPYNLDGSSIFEL